MRQTAPDVKCAATFALIAARECVDDGYRWFIGGMYVLASTSNAAL